MQLCLDEINGDGEPWCCECGKIDLACGTLEGVPFGCVERLEAQVMESTVELEAEQSATNSIPRTSSIRSINDTQI